jgi:hypothetical protein
MYSFANRQDTQVIDEPMYAHYLLKSGVEHPAGKEVLESMHQELSEILSDYIFPRIQKPVYFIKNMAHHFLGMDPSFILNLKNVFLIRDPKLIIRSFAKVIEYPRLQDIGVGIESELYDFLILNNQKAIVIDSADILKNPEKALRLLCKALDINFYSEMLTWEKGPRAEDGPWAKYWYKNLHSSTGFKKTNYEEVIIPDHLESLYQEALPYYQKLKKHSIKI